jgi:hypothetical protein
MIRKVRGGYVVLSESGKVLGRSTSREGAEKRLRQVEYWKARDKGKVK